MRVRMKVDVSGARNGQSWPGRGKTIDLPDDEAAGLCASGMAEPVAADEVETATMPDDVETRALTTQTAAPLTASPTPQEPAGTPAAAEPEPVKAATPVRKTTAKKSATAPAKD